YWPRHADRHGGPPPGGRPSRQIRCASPDVFRAGASHRGVRNTALHRRGMAVRSRHQPLNNSPKARGRPLRKSQPVFVRQCAREREAKSRRRRIQSLPCLERLEGRLVMSTFRVDTTLDTVAANLRTGRDATGHISLRSAIMAADARGGANTIKLRSGTYAL